VLLSLCVYERQLSVAGCQFVRRTDPCSCGDRRSLRSPAAAGSGGMTNRLSVVRRPTQAKDACAGHPSEIGVRETSGKLLILRSLRKFFEINILRGLLASC